MSRYALSKDSVARSKVKVTVQDQIFTFKTQCVVRSQFKVNCDETACSVHKCETVYSAQEQYGSKVKVTLQGQNDEICL